jgi:hypothetical protein
MVSCNVQQVYDAHVACLSPTERLRLVELITRGMAQPEPIDAHGIEPALFREIPGWQDPEPRGDLSHWRDRAL